MEEKIINDKPYRLVTLRNRSKWVSRDGDLINPYRNQTVGIHLDECGYPSTGGGVPVHLYVAYGWVDGYFEGAEVNHKDFDRTNFNADNLEWVTHHDNVIYSVQNNSDIWNKSKQGEHNGRAKLNSEDILAIRDMYDNQNMSIREIYNLYANKVTESSVANVCNRVTWTSV